MASRKSVSDDKELYEALKHVLDIVEMEQERNYVSNSELFDHLLGTYGPQMNESLRPTRVADDYVGVHLGQVYEDSDLQLLIKSFRNNQTLDAFYALKIIADAQRCLRDMPNIRECYADVQCTGVVIVGDLHGNFHDLIHLIEKYGLPGQYYKFVFNGDFVDRGEKQIECLLTLLYAFLLRPNSVFLNRGNHEDISINISSHFDPNFLTEVRKKYGKYSSCVFNDAVEMFPYLPLATIVSNVLNVRIFVVHGGISSDTDLDYVRREVSRVKSMNVASRRNMPDGQQISGLLWSDPIRVEHFDGGFKLRPKGAKKATGCYFNEQRNLGSLFGVDITEAFCRRWDFDCIVRSHEVREMGHSQDHARCNTVFSASYYCNGNNMGAVLVLGTRDPEFHVYKYRNIGGDMSSLLAKKNHALVKQFKRLIQTAEAELTKQFSEYDPDNSGYVSEKEWSDVLAEHFHQEINPSHLLALKDFMCECESENELVNYRTMFSSGRRADLSSTENQNFLIVIKNLFELMDKNHDNRISLDEARDALELANKKVGAKYAAHEQCYNFIKQLDTNGDNYIDLDEFKQAFFEDEAFPKDKHRDRDHEHEDTTDSEASEEGDVQIVRL